MGNASDPENLARALTDWELTYRLRDGVERRVPLSAAVALPIEALRPVRRFGISREMRNKPAMFYSAAAQRLVRCESRREARALELLEYEGIVAVAEQPFRVEHKQRGRGPVPDFLVAWPDGRRTVIDVTGPGRKLKDKTKAALEVKRLAAGALDWEYRVVAQVESVFARNIDWLGRSRFAPPETQDYASGLLAACASQISLDELIRVIEAPPALVLPVIFHLCWRQQIVFDLDRPLRLSTALRAAPRFTT